MGALAEFECDLIRERTNAGLAAARARGRVGGRPRKLSTNGKVALAQRLFADKKYAIDDICSTLGISRSTLYRYVREAKKASRPSDPPAYLCRNLPQNLGIYTFASQNGETLCPVTMVRAKTLLEPRFFPLSHKGLDKWKISVYTLNYERTLAATTRSSIG